jgi:hypothetical protein
MVIETDTFLTNTDNTWYKRIIKLFIWYVNDLKNYEYHNFEVTFERIIGGCRY